MRFSSTPESDTWEPSSFCTRCLAGTALLAVGVSMVETPCSAGYPVLWADMLAAQNVSLIGAIPLLALYMAVFLIDELVVFAATAIGIRALKLEERAGRLLKLLSGTVMIALAGTLILVPEAMNSLTSAVAVFGIAVGAAVAIALVEKLRRPAKPDRQPPSKLIKSH